MIEHHRRVICKPGTHLKDERLSLTRAPLTNFKLWNDELKEGEDFTLDLDQGVLIFLRNVKIKSYIGVEFKFDNPEGEKEKVDQKGRKWWHRIFGPKS